jgi:SAM-dependent methyltransferase
MPHWTEKLFIQQSDLILKFLKRGEKQTYIEINALQKIFSDDGIYRNGRVLDLCCGYGRHSLQLAKRGYQVTGIDLSPTLINHAKDLTERMDLSNQVEFLVGDIRKISTLLNKKSGYYDAIINMFTSIGYYDDETDKNVLKQLHDLASDNGILIIDIANRDWIIKHFQHFNVRDIDDGVVEIHQHRRFDYDNSRMENTYRFYKKKGEELKHLTTVKLNHRLYSLHEFKRLYETTGWKYLYSYGNFELDPVSPDNNRIIIIGRKK